MEDERRQELAEKWLERCIPEELRDFEGCKVFDRAKLDEMKPLDVKNLVVGDIDLDSDELQILKLNPKFAVMLRLDDEEMERDVELAMTKMRYENRRVKEKELMDKVDIENTDDKTAKRVKLDKDADKLDKIEEANEKERNDIIEDAQERQIFNLINLEFDYSKRRVTDLGENNKVH